MVTRILFVVDEDVVVLDYRSNGMFFCLTCILHCKSIVLVRVYYKSENVHITVVSAIFDVKSVD